MKLKKKLKNQNAITLIALVITIIVLLILAGVALNAINGENGILSQAQKAKELSHISKIEENVKLAVMSSKINESTKINYTKLNEELNKIGYKGENIEESDLPAEIIIDGVIVTIEQNGTVSKGELDKPLSENALVLMFKNAQEANCEGGNSCISPDKHLHIGDYVEYKPISGQSTSVTSSETGNYQQEGVELPAQSFTVNENTTWRVLGLDEEKNEVLLISGSPIKKDGENPYLIMGGPEGYANMDKVLNKITNIYHNSKYASETRSINLDDINKAFGIIVSEGIIQKENDSEVEIQYQYAEYEWPYYETDKYALSNYLYDKGDTTQIRKKFYDVEDYINYTYVIDENVVPLNGELYEVLCAGTTANENFAKKYWINSTLTRLKGGAFDEHIAWAVFQLSDNMIIGGDENKTRANLIRIVNTNSLFDVRGSRYIIEQAVRPIISLKSKITSNDLNIISYTEITEETWNTVPAENGNCVETSKVTIGQVDSKS